MKAWKLVLYLSALGTAFGVFLPLRTLQVFGQISYYDVMPDESHILMAFALLAPALMIIEQRVMTVFCALGVWGTLFYPAVRHMMKPRDNSLLGDLKRKLSESVQDYAFDLFRDYADLDWGGYVFLGCAALFTVCCVRIALK